MKQITTKTTINISKELRDKLKSLRIAKRESYEEIIFRLILTPPTKQKYRFK